MSSANSTTPIPLRALHRTGALLACLLALTGRGATTSAGPRPEVMTLSAAIVVDPSFAPNLQGQPTALVAQPDGRILVLWHPTQHLTMSALSRLNGDGSIDSSFHLSSFGYGSISSIEVESDGRVLLAGDITIAPSVLRAGFVRLEADGTIDDTFKLPAIATGHVLLSDNRIVVISITGSVATLTRLNADGSPDSSYPGGTFALGSGAQASLSNNYSRVISAGSPDGYIVGVVFPGTGGTSTPSGTGLFRLRADGTPDTGFKVTSVAGAIQQLVDTGDHVFYVSREEFFPAGYSLHLGRLTAAGAVDTSYSSTDGNGGPASGPIALLMPDGGAAWLSEGAQAISTGMAGVQQSLRRINSDGVADAGFASMLSTAPSYSHIDQLVADKNGRLLAFGTFNAIGGVAVTNLTRIISDPQPYATRLTNLSVRQSSGTGSSTLTIGFVVEGSGQKKILARAIGPSLRQFAISTPLPDPQLALLDAAGVVRVSNDNWDATGNPVAVADTAASVGAFPLATGAKDAAAIALLSEGSYSVQIGTNGGTGVALAEGYDADAAPADYSSARVVNFSARGSTSGGEATLTAGFGIAGPGLKRVLIRAAGPSLNQYGVAGTLADPALTVFSGQTVIASNNDWSGSTDVAEAGAAVGAFPLHPKDAAIVMTLPAGTYTVQVSGADGGAGVALVEVYEVR